MKKGMFEIYKDTADEWRWRLKARNGKVIAVSEGYTSKAGCLNGVRSVQSTLTGQVYIKEPNRPVYII
jgi:uncharacterized protein YegP (UPF0339 family)